MQDKYKKPCAGKYAEWQAFLFESLPTSFPFSFPFLRITFTLAGPPTA